MRASRLVLVPLLAGGLIALHRLGGDGLTVPLGTTSGLADWAGATEPVALAMAALRLAALVLCAYLLLATVLQLLADALGYPWLTLLARKAVPFAVRHALGGGAGLSLAAGSVLGTTAAPAGASPGPGRLVVTAVDDAAPGAPTATMTLLDPAPPGPTAAMVLLEPAPADAAEAGAGAAAPGGDRPAVSLVPAPLPVADAHPGPEETPPGSVVQTPATTRVPASPGPSVPPAMDAPHTPPASAAGGDEHEVWVVGAGDSFWSIAEDVVGAGGDHVRAYWEQLIAANADRLAVPDQPDLLFPGQRLTLPPPAPREG